jgi:hypothetical protein
MTKRVASLTSSLLALGIAAFAGSALAGNGNGNGNAAAPIAPAASEPASQGAAPENSANAPGQLKKDTASTQAQGGGSADQNSASVNGIKPTNSTSKGTMCSTGGGTGSSATCSPTTPNPTAATAGNGDASKRYGNGTTAAQIANGRGAPAGTPVYGPGNSQPHKVACPGTEKYIDVHAMKSYAAQCEAAAPTSNVVTPKVTPAGVPSPAAVSVSVPGGAKGAPAAGGAPAPAAPQGGILGVTTSGKSGPVGGVLGAIEVVGEGALPFTGFPLWAAVAIALTLIVLGLTLRRRARVTA